MSAIRDALVNLDQSISHLEGKLDQIPAAKQGEQPDMFPETKQAIVKSLDSMISSVETLLEDSKNG